MTGLYGRQGNPLIFTNLSGISEDAKLTEDRYEIYLNQDFIGYKSLLNTSDELSDIDDFLKNQGIHEFQTRLDGDHYYVTSTNDDRIRDVLTIYFQNR
jgi:hypothetical protein